jgi:hypothetical protein
MIRLPGLTLTKLSEEYGNWYQTPRILRFGQYILNRYLPGDQSWPEVYYEEDTRKVFARIMEVLDCDS